MPALEGDALGLVETKGLVAGVEACDAMLKAANVRLVGMEQTVPALITIKVTGETAAVRSSVEAGAAAASRIGSVVSTHVIPRPAPEVARMVAGSSAAGGTSTQAGEDLSELTVKKLRELAREIEDFPLSGREISRATKDELIALLSAS